MSELSLEQSIRLAADQYHIENAVDTIAPASELEDVFSPPHHGPRHIPISVADADHGDNFTHFPIVNGGVYYLFLPHEQSEVEVFDMHYNGPAQQEPAYMHIELDPIDAEALQGTPFKQGFKSKSPIVFNQSDPQPIAIHFSVRSDETGFAFQYIVV